MNTCSGGWIPCSIKLPPEKVLVETVIDNAHGYRNEGRLIRFGRLWFLPDMSMYVYYQPTHWREVKP